MSATEILTAVLVVITGYYAYQNRKMALEMKAAREVAVLPKLALEWTMVSPVLGFPTVKNVGPGPALDVSVELTFEPLPSSSRQPVKLQWVASVLVAGEEKQFLPPDDTGGNMMDTEALAVDFQSVRLAGDYRNALGEPQVAEDELANIEEWRRISKEARGRWEEPDPTKRLAKELSERFGKKLLVPALKAIEQRLSR